MKALATTLFFASTMLYAQEVSFDPNGQGNLVQLTPNGIGDIEEGNLVMIQPGPLGAGDVGTTFELRYQAVGLFAIFNDASIDFPFPPAEITVQAVIPLQFTGITGNRCDFALNNAVAPGPGNQITFFHHTPGNADVNTGTGYGDGTPILAGSFFDVFFSIDLTDLPGTFLASFTVTGSDANFFDIPPTFYGALDGAAVIPSQLLPSTQIVNYTPITGDTRGSVDLTLDFAVIPEASTLMLAGLAAAMSTVVLIRRRAD